MANVESNVYDVIDSIDDVQDDIHDELNSRLRRVMKSLKLVVGTKIRNDASYTGQLQRAISREKESTSDGFKMSVVADGEIAPYARIVEYGSGQRGADNEQWEGSEQISSIDRDNMPADWPYDSPSMNVDLDNPYKLSGRPQFAVFVGHIEKWMKRKPVEPESGDIFTSAVAIAATIIEKGNYGHPFMRPAWNEMEDNIRSAAQRAIWNATR